MYIELFQLESKSRRTFPDFFGYDCKKYTVYLFICQGLSNLNLLKIVLISYTAEATAGVL